MVLTRYVVFIWPEQFLLDEVLLSSSSYHPNMVGTPFHHSFTMVSKTLKRNIGEKRWTVLTHTREWLVSRPSLLAGIPQTGALTVQHTTATLHYYCNCETFRNDDHCYSTIWFRSYYQVFFCVACFIKTIPYQKRRGRAYQSFFYTALQKRSEWKQKPGVLSSQDNLDGFFILMLATWHCCRNPPLLPPLV